MGWWWSGGESLGDGRHGPPYMGKKPRWRPENHFQPTSLRPSVGEITNKKHPHFLIEIWKSWKCWSFFLPTQVQNEQLSRYLLDLSWQKDALKVQCHSDISVTKVLDMECLSVGLITFTWSNYSDLRRPHPKWWFSKGNPFISGISRLVKYYNLTR